MRTSKAAAYSCWPRRARSAGNYRWLIGRSRLVVNYMTDHVEDALAGGSNGEWLRGRRRQALLTQEELAARSGVDARTIRDIETSRTAHPRASTVRQILDALTAAEQDMTVTLGGRRSVVPPHGVAPAEAEEAASAPADRAVEITELEQLLKRVRQQQNVEVIAAASEQIGRFFISLARPGQQQPQPLESY